MGLKADLCIITLQCRCTLKTKYAFISASLRGCENEVITSGIDTHQDPLEMLPEIQIPEYIDIQEYVDDEQTEEHPSRK
jgi:hypothetical protein